MVSMDELKRGKRFSIQLSRTLAKREQVRKRISMEDLRTGFRYAHPTKIYAGKRKRARNRNI